MFVKNTPKTQGFLLNDERSRVKTAPKMKAKAEVDGLGSRRTHASGRK